MTVEVVRCRDDRGLNHVLDTSAVRRRRHHFTQVSSLFASTADIADRR